MQSPQSGTRSRATPRLDPVPSRSWHTRRIQPIPDERHQYGDDESEERYPAEDHQDSGCQLLQVAPDLTELVGYAPLKAMMILRQPVFGMDVISDPSAGSTGHFIPSGDQPCSLVTPGPWNPPPVATASSAPSAV